MIGSDSFSDIFAPILKLTHSIQTIKPHLIIKKLFFAATLLFAITGGVSKAAPATLEARGNYMAVNDTIIKDNVPVEIPAQYPGGNKAIFFSIQKNTEYPTDALCDETQGEAVVNFACKRTAQSARFLCLKACRPRALKF